MIGQQSSLPILLPIALEELESDPLAEGDLFAVSVRPALRRRSVVDRVRAFLAR